MQFLKILLWCLLAFVAAIFTFGNWTWVTINLWGGLVAEVNLPFLMLLTFLAGWLPTWLYFRTQRWRLAQRLNTAERVIADLKPAPVAIAADPVPVPPMTTNPGPGATGNPAQPTLPLAP
ncbi:MAG: hypothetical protein JSR79_04040 [Proteobacteria bacterium]|nr:hypothetical protein [Pseudomonadota bacterium]